MRPSTEHTEYTPLEMLVAVDGLAPSLPCFTRQLSARSKAKGHSLWLNSPELLNFDCHCALFDDSSSYTRKAVVCISTKGRWWWKYV